MNKYGLLGEKLSHSQSKIIHEFFFKENDIDATYDLIEVSEDKLKEIIDLVKNGIYQGLNVTIPYKEKVIKYLDLLTEAAKEIGAVNTIYLKDDKLIGDNTDYLGFIDQLAFLDLDVTNKDVYVLGSGGASKGICYALKQLKANPIVISRNREKGLDYAILNDVETFDLLVNTTPVGMYPNVNDEILSKDIVSKAKCSIDLICNPKTTKFLEYSSQGYNGIYMLIFQALHAEYIWGNQIDIDINKLYELL